MKAAYSILWVEPGSVKLLGVNSRKIMWGLDREVFSFSCTNFSLNVICWSVFLRCLYQPMTLSCGEKRHAVLAAAEMQKNSHWLYLLIVRQDFLYNIHIHITNTVVEATNTQISTRQTTVNIWDHIWKVSSTLCSTHLFSWWQGMCFCTSV